LVGEWINSSAKRDNKGIRKNNNDDDDFGEGEGKGPII